MGRAREIADLIGGTTPDIILKTSDGAILNLQTSDTTVTADSVLGTINFQAPDEASGTDSILIGSKIEAIAEGTFAADNNATKLVFSTGASEAAASKMTLSSGGVLNVDGGITVDNITIDGTEIDLSSGDLTLDSAGEISLDSGTGVIRVKDGGTQFGSFIESSNNFIIKSQVSDGDLVLMGNDGGAEITAMTIDMSEGGKVGIGTTSPNAKLALSGTGTVDLGIGSTNAGGAYLYLDGDSNGDFSGSDYSYIGHDTSGQLLIHQDSPSGSDNILLKTNGSTRWTLNSSGNLFPAATSQGIVLGATSDTAANRLDDYEEGTFTATMANSVTLTSNYDSLAYTKIGRQVTVTGQIQINSDNSNSHTVITNLPFTHFTQSSPNEDADRAFCAVRLYNHDAADDAQFVGAFTAEGTTNLYFVNVRDNAANTDLDADASGYLMFTITYFST